MLFVFYRKIIIILSFHVLLTFYMYTNNKYQQNRIIIMNVYDQNVYIYTNVYTYYIVLVGIESGSNR